MKRIKILQGACVEHWMDKRIREGKSIALPGNYIRIPAKAFIEFQKLKNETSHSKQSLYEANREWETNGGEC